MTAAEREAVGRARIVGHIDPEDTDRFLCDIEIPGHEFAFVAEVVGDGTVALSAQAPAWLVGDLAEQLAEQVLRARKRAGRDVHADLVAMVTARRSLVMEGRIMDSGKRRGGQVAWVHRDIPTSARRRT